MRELIIYKISRLAPLYGFAVGFQPIANAPPIIPSIAPMKKPPVPVKLTMEKINMTVQAPCSAGRAHAER